VRVFGVADPRAGLSLYIFVEGEYVLQQPDDQGILRSQGFPGLQLAVEALLAGGYAAGVGRRQRADQEKQRA
jgi:hypothetical protein